MYRLERMADLAAFITTLATVVVLLLFGVPPESLAIVVVAIGGLYGAWLGNGQRSRSVSRADTDEERWAQTPPRQHDPNERL
jgi:uncharacterized membrane protein YfcA